jgi:hypothetical protein
MKKAERILSKGQHSMNFYIEHLQKLFQEGKQDELVKTGARYMISDVLTKEENDEVLDFFVKNLPDDVIEKIIKDSKKKKS